MFTNNSGISLSLSIWLCYDEYDYDDDPNTISTTSLLKPMREIILARQNKDLMKAGDISSLIASSMGTALHDSIEKSWTTAKGRDQAFKKLGYPKAVVDKILINPSKDELYDGCIPVYMEQRSVKQVGKYKVSGKFDFVIEARLEDFKSCSAYSYTMQSNADKYVQQGSIYRWLNPDIIKNDIMAIQYIFTDWSKLESIKNPKYPQSKLLEQQFTLMSLQETETFVGNILSQVSALENAGQDELPRCTPEELWIKPSVWKYYKDPTKTARSTKNFTDSSEAYARASKDGNVGIVKEIKGQVERCKYCSVSALCNQAAELVSLEVLTL